MVKRCPPGVICIENITIVFIIIVFCLAAFVWVNFCSGGTCSPISQVINMPKSLPESIPKFNSIFSTNPTNTLMNPFAPPLKNNNYLPTSDPRGVPINISTRGLLAPLAFSTHISTLKRLLRDS